MAENQSFVFYRSFADALEKMEPEECKACLMSLCSYALDGEERADTPISGMFLSLVKPQIDANTKRREAGRRGGKANGSTAEANGSKVKQARSKTKQTEANVKQTEANRSKVEANGSKPKQNEANPKQSEANANANVNANVNVKDNPPTPFTVLRAGAEELEELGLTQEVAQPMSDWIAIRREGKRPITETSFKYAVSRAKEAVQKYGGERVAALIRDSVASGYDGIPWDRLKEQRASPQRPKGWDFEQKADYDMSELEDRLLAN